MREWARASEWWRMPLIGVLIGGPISLTASLFLASYGAEGPYGGFWRLLLAGLAASVPIFTTGGVLFAPLEIWLTQRSRRLRVRYALLLRGGVLGLAGVAGAVVAHLIVVALLVAPPPPTLFPVLLMTYMFIGTIIGLSYTFYDAYVYQLRLSTELTQEMRVARGIQQGLFPRQSPRIPGFDVGALCQPALETGGDFYDYIEFGDGRVGLVIADVVGKGMPAALLMANTRALWRAEAQFQDNPAETLRRVNRSLYRDINSDGFVTLLYAILDPHTRQLCVASAGHPLPVWHGRAGVSEIEVLGLPLGLKQDAGYDELSVSLEPGDVIVVYTDGITEAVDGTRELFGLERLVALIKSEATRPASDLATEACSQARRFSGRTGQADDMTVVVLKALP